MKLKHMKKENGQAMVEFALVLPLLLLLVGGIIDFGWIFYNQISANNASREAARYIAIHYIPDNMSSKSHYATDSAEDVAFGIVDAYSYLDLTINDIEEIEPVKDVDNIGYNIKVKFSGDVKILTPIISTIIDKDDDGMFVISSECTMRIEQ